MDPSHAVGVVLHLSISGPRASVLFALSPILVGAAHDGQLFSTGIYTKVKSQGAKLMSFGVPFMCVDKLEQTFIRIINNKVNSNRSLLNKIAQLIIESR